jgi:hypothetical protein
LRATLHVLQAYRRALSEEAAPSEDENKPYPTRQAVKRAAFALALALGVAGAADFG